MDKIIGHIIKDYIAIRVYMLWISFMKILFVISMLIAICFTTDTYKDFYENDSLKTKVAYKIFENVRFNLRIIVATFLPIANLVKNELPVEEQNLLPKAENAMFKMDRNQWAGLKMMNLESKMLENLIYTGYRYAQQAYKESNWSSIDWNVTREKKTAQEQTTENKNIELY